MFFLLSVLAYFLVGVFYARKVYAIRSLEARNAGQDAIDSRINVLQLKLDSIKHGICDISYRISSTCDCSKRILWRKYNDELQALRAGVSPEPKVWPMALAWPVYGLTSFMHSGSVKKPDYSSIRYHEEFNEIN